MSGMGFPNDPTFYGDDLPPMPRPLNKPGITVTSPDQFAEAAYILAARDTDPRLLDQEN